MYANQIDTGAAAPLLREAVQGLTAVYMYSAEHQLVQQYQMALTLVTRMQCCAAVAAAGYMWRWSRQWSRY